MATLMECGKVWLVANAMASDRISLRNDCQQADIYQPPNVCAMKPNPFSLLLLISLLAFTGAAAEPDVGRNVEVKKIWDKGAHNAFTDLIWFKEEWLCVFREATGHGSHDGALRVIASRDGVKWESRAFLRLTPKIFNTLNPKVAASGNYMDLRDPHICITPDGRLMLNSALVYNDRKDLQSLTWFSSDSRDWGKGVLIGEHQFWIWRVTWHKGKAYGVGRIASQRIPRLYESDDDRSFRPIVKGQDFIPLVPGPSEGTVRFLANGTAFCLQRLNNVPGAKTANAQLGTAQPPYTRWAWKDLGARIGGPNMIPMVAGWPGCACTAQGRTRRFAGLTQRQAQ